MTDLTPLIERIIVTQDEMLQSLTATQAVLEKVSAEITVAKANSAALQAAVADLEARIAADAVVAADVQAAVEGVRAMADRLDAQLPDAPKA